MEATGTCGECGWRTPSGAPACRRCADWLLADQERAFAAWVAEQGLADEPVDAVARLVVDDPSSAPWRVVDAAMRRIPCTACGAATGSGPTTCGPCGVAHGFRFAAREPERRGTPPGTEHAIRVATAVAMLPHRFPAHMVPRYATSLVLALDGQLPSGGTARAVNRWLDAGGDLDALRRCRTEAELVALIRA